MGAKAATAGASRVSLGAFRAFTNAGTARAAGTRNLSDAEVVAVVRVTIDKRR